MEMKDFYEKLGNILPGECIKTNEPMSRHTTFRIGGPARYYVRPKTREQLARTAMLCRRENVSWYVVGHGSNLLAGDEGYDGVILSTEGLTQCQVEGEEMRAEAGLLLSRAAKEAARMSLGSFEFAAGIPGTVGGAVVMNAGAYGSELKDVLTWVRVLDTEGKILTLEAGELELGYRTSRIPSEGYVVLEAGFKLAAGDREAILGRMEELAAKRREKQPLDYPSAGSTFKRPAGHFAGKLIEDAGLRGFRVGGAQVSEKHCGFVINRKDATAADVMELCREVKRRVREQSGVELELEVKLL
ncbi:MAG: UDP-N-acetylmuramate dehydrogenase [Hungatella sp.]|nr:UDP-N-acetylmuramate dehydrogenase [Hungatella sp.]